LTVITSIPQKASRHQQMLVTSDEHVGPGGNRALEQPIVRRVGVHDVQRFRGGDQLREPADPSPGIGCVVGYPVELVGQDAWTSLTIGSETASSICP
jgi:hypothetical protein